MDTPVIYINYHIYRYIQNIIQVGSAQLTRIAARYMYFPVHFYCYSYNSYCENINTDSGAVNMLSGF